MDQIRLPPYPMASPTTDRASEEERVAMSKDWANERLGITLADRYRIESLLGAGGTGAVYRAVEASTGAAFAVKLLAPELLEHAYFLERFQRECSAASSVGTPGVPKVFDMGHADDVGPFLVMELLEGRTLAEHLKQHGPLSLGESVQITREIVNTLEAVHGAGVVHRDLKPANVFLAGEGLPWIVKVLDFGVARFWELSSDTVLTFPGSVVGTPRFMPPEQAADASRANPRCDIYAAGAILYSCLSGLPPYHDESGASVAAALLAGPPKALSEVAPQVAGAVAWVAERAMAREPSDRFETAGAMSKALDAALQQVADAWADGYGAQGSGQGLPGERTWSEEWSLQATREVVAPSEQSPDQPPSEQSEAELERAETTVRPNSSSPPGPMSDPLSGAGTTPIAESPDRPAAEPAFVMPPAFGSPPGGPTPAFGPGSGHPAPSPPPPSNAGGLVGSGPAPKPRKSRRWLLLGVLLVGLATVLGVMGAGVWWYFSEGDDGGTAALPDPLPPFAVPVGISGRPDADRGFARLASGDRAVCSTLRGVVVPPGRLSEIQADLRLGQLDCVASGLGDSVSTSDGAALADVAAQYTDLQRSYLEVIERAPPKAGPCVHVRLAELQLRMAVIAERAQSGAATVEQWTQAASASYRAARAVGAGTESRCAALATERASALRGRQ